LAEDKAMFNTAGGIQGSVTSVDVKRLHVSLHSHFRSKGLDPKKAATWSLLCIELHSFAQKDPHIQAAVRKMTLENAKKSFDIGTDVKSVYGGGMKIYQAGRYIARSAAPLGLSSGGFIRYGAEGAYGLTSVGLKYIFAPFARQHGLQLDESGVALAVLCFGLAASGVGEVVFSFALVIDILATAVAGYDFGKAALETIDRFKK
jgi:hypothetical protein